MNRRTRTVVAAGLLALALGVLGARLPVPFVALGPGPTFDTLGESDGAAVVTVDGLPVYPTTGQLNMTTVSVSDGITLFGAVGLWASGERRILPRAAVFPPDRTADEIQQQNTQQFASSEANAQTAALNALGIPTRVLVEELTPDSPAAGILEPGDEIVTVQGRAVSAPAEVADALSDTAPGETARITMRRGGVEREVQVVLGSSPDRTQGLLGVIPGTAPRDGTITISLAGIGGPSAGLMFALAVVDKLTPGALTGGTFVAGTGAISSDGTVAPIDGIPFKMRAAQEAGATVFLVPAQNCAEARDTAPDGLQLVEVTALDDAIADLDALRAGTPVSPC